MNPIQKSILVGILTIVIYLAVVVVTTPALGPLDAINAAFQLNAIVIVGMGIGVGMQIFLSEKSKLLGCKLNVKRESIWWKLWKYGCYLLFLLFLPCSLGLLWLVALCVIPASKCCRDWRFCSTN